MRTSVAIPVVSALSALAELTANLVRSASQIEIAEILRRSLKWILPIDHVSMVVYDSGWRHLPAGDPYDPPFEIARVLVHRSAAELKKPACGALVGDESLNGLFIFPLADGIDIAALVLGVRDVTVLDVLDLGTCHLVAHNIVSALRMVRLLERERLAREEAELAIRGRDKMIQAVTHDLRNPLAVVMTMFEMVMMDVPEDAVPSEDIEAIHTSLGRMKGLVDELLDVAKSERGELTIKRGPTDLVTLIGEAARGAKALLRGHVLELDVPQTLLGDLDEARIARVLGNLVSNAIKYSPQGGRIRISASETNGWAELHVTDSGIGIPAADLPHVFERFRRATNVGRIDGNGIGLAASREVMHAHGGTLEVQSIEGKGSTFIMRVPLAVE